MPPQLFLSTPSMSTKSRCGNGFYSGVPKRFRSERKSATRPERRQSAKGTDREKMLLGSEIIFYNVKTQIEKLAKETGFAPSVIARYALGSDIRIRHSRKVNHYNAWLSIRMKEVNESKRFFSFVL